MPLVSPRARFFGFVLSVGAASAAHAQQQPPSVHEGWIVPLPPNSNQSAPISPQTPVPFGHGQPPPAIETAPPPQHPAFAPLPTDIATELSSLEARSERQVCGVWLAAQTPSANSRWYTPGEDECAVGSVSTPAIEDAHRLLNGFRWLSGVGPVALNPALAEQQNQCAVMMAVNNQANHHPPPSWRCFTQAGATAAAASNLHPMLQGTDIASTVDGYINETVPSLGHRRWSLYPRLAPTYFGAVARASCMYARTNFSATPAGPPVVVFPNPGPAPIENFRTNYWSVQDGTLSVTGGTVRVFEHASGQQLPIEMVPMPSGFAGNALAWRASGWTPTANHTYRVELTLPQRNGTQNTLTWRTTPVLCGGARSGPNGEPRGWHPPIPPGALALAPNAPVPSAPGTYASWETNPDGTVTTVITTVEIRGGMVVRQEETSRLTRNGGGQRSRRMWTEPM